MLSGSSINLRHYCNFFANNYFGFIILCKLLFYFKLNGVVFSVIWTVYLFMISPFMFQRISRQSQTVSALRYAF